MGGNHPLALVSQMPAPCTTVTPPKGNYVNMGSLVAMFKITGIRNGMRMFGQKALSKTFGSVCWRIVETFGHAQAKLAEWSKWGQFFLVKFGWNSACSPTAQHDAHPLIAGNDWLKVQPSKKNRCTKSNIEIHCAKRQCVSLNRMCVPQSSTVKKEGSLRKKQSCLKPPPPPPKGPFATVLWGLWLSGARTGYKPTWPESSLSCFPMVGCAPGVPSKVNHKLGNDSEQRTLARRILHFEEVHTLFQIEGPSHAPTWSLEDRIPLHVSKRAGEKHKHSRSKQKKKVYSSTSKAAIFGTG